jgi:phosphoenolpyruvate carboxylase
LRTRIFGRIEGRCRTVSALLQITGQKELLEDNAMLARSFRNRRPTSIRSTTCSGGIAPLPSG